MKFEKMKKYQKNVFEVENALKAYLAKYRIFRVLTPDKSIFRLEKNISNTL